uniref:Uncharacterized protein n=1 Tax=viral metagenome TaxID=1070528 RepID=A0A6M3JRN0_9ZZZZ
MATKKVYFGSHGPFVFDDTALVDDPDGDFAGETVRGITTDGQLLIEEAPTEPTNVVRLSDGPIINPTSPQSVTLASGVAAASGNTSYLVLIPEGGAGSGEDTLTSITGFVAGNIVMIRANSDSDTIVVEKNANLNIAIKFVMNSLYDTMLLLCVSTGVYAELSRANNGL